ncbi:MAG TPA: NUDIX hydrolase [Stellaceae bacterium]|nr:NUDIX hydrolase [Stellaceae bacterium]
MSDRPAARDPFLLTIPSGDNRERKVCADCGFIAYENPKIIVGSVCEWQERILLCRRAIDPRREFWTLPAGYLELNEASKAGAEREAMEEAGVRIAIDGLLAVYDIPRLSQVQLIFRARLSGPELAPGPESLEARLFRWDEIPWADLAFPSVEWSLRHYREWLASGDAAPRHNPD